MRFLTFMLGIVLLLPPQFARAQQNTVLLELFTSQGCSSCPPADELLGVLAKRPEVVALALHVDYWDYLGWEDPFASPRNTQRQRAYSREMRRRSVYTPQMVIQGQHVVVGHQAAEISDAIGALVAQKPDVALSIQRVSNTLTIEVRALRDLADPADIHLVRYAPSRSLLINGGENRGREMTYTNVVTDWDTVARWDGRDNFTGSYEGIGVEPVAVIVQSGGIGKVLAAATLR